MIESRTRRAATRARRKSYGVVDVYRCASPTLWFLRDNVRFSQPLQLRHSCLATVLRGRLIFGTLRASQSRGARSDPLPRVDSQRAPRGSGDGVTCAARSRGATWTPRRPLLGPATSPTRSARGHHPLAIPSLRPPRPPWRPHPSAPRSRADPNLRSRSPRTTPTSRDASVAWRDTSPRRPPRGWISSPRRSRGRRAPPRSISCEAAPAGRSTSGARGRRPGGWIPADRRARRGSNPRPWRRRRDASPRRRRSSGIAGRGARRGTRTDGRTSGTKPRARRGGTTRTRVDRPRVGW